jgi:hypothetical protein
MVEFRDILEGHLLSIELDQSLTYAGLSLRTVDGENARIDAISLDGASVEVRLLRLSLRSGLTAVDGTPSLGEIETYLLENDRLTLDGDFGCLELIASRFNIIALK